jgi:hypothetical protein
MAIDEEFGSRIQSFETAQKSIQTNISQVMPAMGMALLQAFSPMLHLYSMLTTSVLEGNGASKNLQTGGLRSRDLHKCNIRYYKKTHALKPSSRKDTYRIPMTESLATTTAQLWVSKLRTPESFEEVEFVVRSGNGTRSELGGGVLLIS